MSQYNPQSNKIVLVQVPEYPIIFEETDEASEVEPDTSLYGEDGSLEVLELLSINNHKFDNNHDIHCLYAFMIKTTLLAYETLLSNTEKKFQVFLHSLLLLYDLVIGGCFLVYITISSN